MKKLLFTTLLTLGAFAAQAQTATPAQLQGSWRMAAFIDQFGTIDIIKGTWKINEGLSGIHKEQVEEMFNDVVLRSQDAVLTIKDDTATQTMAGKEFKGTYTLEDKDGKTFMHMSNNTTGTPQVFVQDNFMHLSDKGFEMVYVKIQ